MEKAEVKVFIGSSSEALKIAHLIKEELDESKNIAAGHSISAYVWDEYPEYKKGNNRTFMQQFEKVLDEYDFGLFVLSKDDTVYSRGRVMNSARDNVWLEAGMFVGRKGLDNVFLFINKNDFADSKVPSDFFGILLHTVTWDSPIVDLYLSNSPLFAKDDNVNKEMKDRVARKLKKQIFEYCEVVVENINDRIKEKTETEKVEILFDEIKCFEKGIDLVKKARKRLYTTISFSNSFEPEKSEKEKEMEDELRNCLNKTSVSFKRFMNCSHSKIKIQYDEFDKLINGNGYFRLNELCDIEFDYLELIISDDSVLMVFPDYRGQDASLYERVAFGFLIKENKVMADILSDWLIAKVAKKRTK